MQESQAEALAHDVPPLLGLHHVGDQLRGVMDVDEVSMRLYVSALWAEDWDCQEDSVYDVI